MKNYVGMLLEKKEGGFEPVHYEAEIAARSPLDAYTQLLARSPLRLGNAIVFPLRSAALSRSRLKRTEEKAMRALDERGAEYARARLALWAVFLKGETGDLAYLVAVAPKS